MVILDGRTLDLPTLKRIARDREDVSIHADNRDLVERASRAVERIRRSDRPVYGINTGFGHLSDVKIDSDKLDQLQVNLLMSHACGVGEPLREDVVRAMMALRINALIKGYSGIRLCVLEMLVRFLNEGITPVVFDHGSLGASGDLVPMAHMSLPLIGRGEVLYKGERMAAEKALMQAKIAPIEQLHAKEGLSLINGTQAMSAIGGLVLYDAFRLVRFANLALSLSMEALEGVTSAFDPRIHEVRGHKGQIDVAREVLSDLKRSAHTTRQADKRVQDAYSLRCAPAVHGASLDALRHARDVVEIEMNAVTDNPIVFSDEEVLSAGNFHGQPLALVFDYAAIALSELGNISERRIERLVNPQLSGGLPAFLTKQSGLNSGFMIIQYVAASLVSENKGLAHPASVDSIPSSANQEDHVSMGFGAATKLERILTNLRRIIALELLAASQALDFRERKTMGKRTKIAYELIRKQIPMITLDEVMYPHIRRIESLLEDEAFYDHIFKGGDDE
ncbi:MAG: histidine ammonia-lyase [Acholeplasmataceae bacterium]